MKRYQLLLIAATLILSSFKADESKMNSVETGNVISFATSQNVQGTFNIGNSEFGYYNVPIKARVAYFTSFGSPNKNIITSITNTSQAFNSTTTVYTGATTGHVSTEYKTACVIDNSSSSVMSNGSSGTLSITYRITYTKTERMVNAGGNQVTTSTEVVGASLFVDASSLSMEIAN